MANNFFESIAEWWDKEVTQKGQDYNEKITGYRTYQDAVDAYNSGKDLNAIKKFDYYTSHLDEYGFYGNSDELQMYSDSDSWLDKHLKKGGEIVSNIKNAIVAGVIVVAIAVLVILSIGLIAKLSPQKGT